MSDPSAVPLPGIDDARRPAAKTTAEGPRKLVRPTLPASASSRRYFGRLGTGISTPAQGSLRDAADSAQESSHAEAFYLQKQAQSQTPMVFVLEDGEQIEGIIEWYDRSAIKVRHGGRTLIYKSSIKYMYKAGENSRP